MPQVVTENPVRAALDMMEVATPRHTGARVLAAPKTPDKGNGKK